LGTKLRRIDSLPDISTPATDGIAPLFRSQPMAQFAQPISRRSNALCLGVETIDYKGMIG
jgi:hypothetical protein